MEKWQLVASALGIVSGAATVLNLALTFSPEKPKPQGGLGWLKWSLGLVVDLASFASQRGSVGIGGSRLSLPGMRSRSAIDKGSTAAPLIVAALGALLASGYSTAHAAVANPTMQQSCANYLAALTNATPAPTTTTTASAGQWGDGSDGTVTLTGTNDVPWATRNGSVYTLTRPVFFVSLTVRDGVTLYDGGGHPIYGRGVLTTIGTGTIRASYGAMGGSSGPSAAQANSIGGMGGVAGNGGSPGGAVTAANVLMLHAYSPSTFGSIVIRGAVYPLTGGSGGGSRGVLPGGRGGGVLNIAFRTFNLASASSLIAPGGPGADSMGDVAASGGGGGGGLNLVYWRKNAVTFSPSVNCPGGAGGGGSSAGTSGQPGNIVEVVIQ